MSQDEKKYIEVECVLTAHPISGGGPCGFKVRLHADDGGASGTEMMNHLRNAHRVWLANIQPISLTNIYSKSPFFVVKETNDAEMQKWVVLGEHGPTLDTDKNQEHGPST